MAISQAMNLCSVPQPEIRIHFILKPAGVGFVPRNCI